MDLSVGYAMCISKYICIYIFSLFSKNILMDHLRFYYWFILSLKKIYPTWYQPKIILSLYFHSVYDNLSYTMCYMVDESKKGFLFPQLAYFS